jgi:DNA-binding MarR family transcriptional regulator
MSPEYKIILKVNAPSKEEANNLIDQINPIVNLESIFISEIRGRGPRRETLDFDSQVRSLHENPDEHLISKQIAGKLDVSLTKVSGSLRRLHLRGEIEPRKSPNKSPNPEKSLRAINREKRDDFDVEVGCIFLSDESKNMTISQMAEKLDVKRAVVDHSIKRLKYLGLIPKIQKQSPLIGSQANLTQQRIKELIKVNPDKHYSLQEFSDKLGVTKEAVRLQLKRLKKKGVDYVTSQKHKSALSESRIKSKIERKYKRDEAVNEVRELLRAGKSCTEVIELLDCKYDDIINIKIITNRLRIKGEIPRIRKIRRSEKEIREKDDEVKILYIEKKSYRQISEITGLDNSQISAALLRLSTNNEVARLKKKSRKKNI